MEFFGWVLACICLVLFVLGVAIPNFWLIIASIPVGMIALVLLDEEFDFWWYW